jgi:hypothetical protein
MDEKSFDRESILRFAALLFALHLHFRGPGLASWSFRQHSWPVNLPSRAARFFLPQLTKAGKIYQITLKCTKKPLNMPDGHKIDQMAILYTNIFYRNTLQN